MMSSVNSSFRRFPHKKGLGLLYYFLIRKTMFFYMNYISFFYILYLKCAKILTLKLGNKKLLNINKKRDFKYSNWGIQFYI